MGLERGSLEDAVDRAMKAASRALKNNDYAKVAEIYYRIAYMLNDLGDEEGAQKFASAAKDFKLKNEVITQIDLARKIADEAYDLGDFAKVAKYYHVIANLSQILGDNATAKQYAAAAEQFQKSADAYQQVATTSQTTMHEYVPNIQSQIPSMDELRKAFSKGATGSVPLDEAMEVLGLVCTNCGHEIDRDQNAAKNLFGTVSSTGFEACGEKSSGSSSYCLSETSLHEAGT